jgi:mannose-1-phosphate guanylyltransferase
VLVGGLGTRLRPLTLTVPKQLLPVAGRPMIERVCAHLVAHGIDEVVLSMGYLPGAFEERYPDGVCAGARLRYAVEDEPLDTGGAIRFAAAEADITERFVVVNGDVLTDLDVGALVAFHEARGAAATIALTRVEDPSRFGVVVTDGTGRVERFVEKPSREEAPSRWVNAGIYVLEPSVVARIPTGRRVSVERETFPALAAEGVLYAMRAEAAWVDAGTPEQYLAANLTAVSGPEPPCAGVVDLGGCRWVAPGAVVEGELRPPLLVDAAARVAPGAVVERSVVGPGARLARDARVSGSVLLAGVAVEEGAVVEDSVIGEGAVVGPGAKVVGGSVVGGGVRVEAGARLDGVREPS